MSGRAGRRIVVWRRFGGSGGLPAEWLASCPACNSEETVLAYEESWEQAMGKVAVHLREAHRRLMSGDAEPPVGTLVRDDCGTVWVNDGCYPCAWLPVEDGDDPESWTKVAGNYGPVTVIEWGDDE